MSDMSRKTEKEFQEFFKVKDVITTNKAILNIYHYVKRREIY